MGHCPPHMVPGGARPAVAQRSEDVRAVRQACPRGPGPPALKRFPGGYAFRDGWAGYRRVSGDWEAGVAASASSRRRLRVGAGPSVGRPPTAGVDVAPPPEVL
jgi:hypothetical protein